MKLIGGLIIVVGLLAAQAQATIYTWVPTGTGTFLWSNSNNWDAGGGAPAGPPGAAGDIAKFTNTLTVGTQKTTVGTVTVGKLLVGDAGNAFAFPNIGSANGEGTITMDNLGGGALIQKVNSTKTDQIRSNLVLKENLTVDNTVAGSRLMIRGFGSISENGGSFGITKVGPGEVYLDTDLDTYTGNTVVQQGRLTLSGGEDNSIITSGRIIVQNGGQLFLDDFATIADTVPMTLAGGAFILSTQPETIGKLMLTDNSFIDVGGGSHFKAAASDTEAWTSGKVLTIQNWDEATQLVFGADGTALTAAQLLEIKFLNPTGFAPGIYDAAFAASGEVVPVLPEAKIPEPMSTMGVGVGLMTLAAYVTRRRRVSPASRG